MRIAYQQKDVLIAIQQLRDEAVAKGIIKTDDKVKVVTENDNVVIQSAEPEKIYVPQYEPADALRAGLCAGSRSPTIPIPIRTTTIRRRPFSPAW